jgi:hypothetical protein
MVEQRLRAVAWRCPSEEPPSGEPVRLVALAQRLDMSGGIRSDSPARVPTMTPWS